MPQSDGVNSLKRMEFEFNGQSYAFNINPEEYNIQEPNRSTVTQTKSGAFVDDFGAGLQTVYLKGQTGFRGTAGIEKFKELRNFIRGYWSSITPGQTVTNELTWHNFTDDESWIVHTDPQGFKLMRSTTNPLLYYYEIYLICLRPASSPTTQSQTGGVNTTVGTPSKIASASRTPTTTPSSNTNKAAVAAAYMGQTLSMNGSTPSASLTNFASQVTTLPEALVKEFGAGVASTIPLNLQYFGDVASAQDAIATSFDPTLSQLALNTLAQIRTGGLITSLVNAPDGSLVAKFTGLKTGVVTNDILTACRIIALETMSLTINLNTQNPDFVVNNMSPNDLSRLATNIHWLSDQFAKIKNTDYDLINELRWLERVVRYIQTSSLYVTDISGDLDKINTARSDSNAF